MAEQAKVVPAEESKDTETVETKTEESPKEDVKVGDALNTREEKKEPRMVPEAVLIEYKKENKQIAKDLRDLKTLIESGATKKEVSTDLKSLADKHGFDADFLGDFAEAVRKEAEDAAEAKLKPIKEKEIASAREKIFEEHFAKTMAEMPEYASLVNKDVIKTLAYDPVNVNKTFAQIFQDSYGHLVTGRKTLDTTKPRGGIEATDIDLQRASRDPEYFKEVMADPELKKKYNDEMAIRNKF